MGSLDAPAEVRREDSFDEGALAGFLRQAFPGDFDASGGGPAPGVSVSQFPAGHSNLTFLVRFGGREMVLRRAPRGVDVKSAHDMGREFAVLSALSPLYSKAPKALAFCDDASVIGAPFFLMERIPGPILRSASPPPGLSLSPYSMRVLSENLVDELASLHALDVSAGPLAALGKPEGYAARQVAGWTERWERAKTDDVPELDAAAAWLAAHVPPAGRPSLLHNDFKFDNVVLDPRDPARISAVLDWEMAALGDPLLDLGTTLGYWVDPDDDAEVRALPVGATRIPGCMTRAEAAARWAEKTSRPRPDLLFAYVFGLFKIAGIAQQIFRRYALGHTRDPRFATLLQGVRILGRQAARTLERGRLS
jgi:aminoglycoside phosphotransferase (APT) family kinase protein